MKVTKIIVFLLFALNCSAQTRYYPTKPSDMVQGKYDYYKIMLDTAYEQNDLYNQGVAFANMGETKEIVYKTLNQAVEYNPRRCYDVHTFNNLLLDHNFTTTLTKLSLEDWQKLCAKCLTIMDSTEFNRLYAEALDKNQTRRKRFFDMDSSKLNLPLMNRLSEIKKKDQLYRNQMAWATPEQTKELWDKQNQADAENLTDIENIINTYGFPGKSLVGDKCDVAILVLHHQPKIEVHEKYLSVIEELVNKKEIGEGSLNMYKLRIDLHKAANKK